MAMHPASTEATRLADAAGLPLLTWLERRVADSGIAAGNIVGLAKTMHVVPEFLGNRSPHADPDARAIIAGLSLETSVDDLLGLYIAGLCGIGYGLRQILNSLRAGGLQIDVVIASGGAAQSDSKSAVIGARYSILLPWITSREGCPASRNAKCNHVHAERIATGTVFFSVELMKVSA